jgi:hypothetical protein
MAFVVKKTEYAKMSEGIHQTVISRVEDLGEVDTQKGKKLRCAVYFQALDEKDKDGNPIEARITANQSLGPKSTLGKLIATLTGVAPGAEFEMESLVGIKCQVVIEHVTKDGQTYANIQTVIRPTRKAVEV